MSDVSSSRASNGTVELTRPERPPTIAELKAICRKSHQDPIWIVNVFWRPFSIYITWALLKLRIRANTVTAISCVAALLSSYFVLTPALSNYVLAAVFMQLFLLLDQVDGEAGRYYASKHKGPRRDFSGSYFDRLVHYFHGTSFYFCLGAGLFRADGNPVWLLLGAAGGVGSGGHPRFAASYELLGVVLSTDRKAVRDFAGKMSAYYAVYGPSISGPREFFLIPKTKEELLIAAKQWLTFPGFLFTFAGAVVAAWLVAPELWPLKVFLVFHATLLCLNVIHATRTYLVALTNVPTD